MVNDKKGLLFDLLSGITLDENEISKLKATLETKQATTGKATVDLHKPKHYSRKTFKEIIPEVNPEFKIFDPKDYSNLNKVKDDLFKWLEKRWVILKSEKDFYYSMIGNYLGFSILMLFFLPFVLIISIISGSLQNFNWEMQIEQVFSTF